MTYKGAYPRSDLQFGNPEFNCIVKLPIKQDMKNMVYLPTATKFAIHPRGVKICRK